MKHWLQRQTQEILLVVLLFAARYSNAFTTTVPVESKTRPFSVHSWNDKVTVATPAATTTALQSKLTSIDTFTSGLASILRIQHGVTVSSNAPKNDDEVPIQIKKLYDIENDANCRKVRERITELNLIIEKVIPATPNSRIFSNKNDPYSLPSNALIPTMVVIEKNSSGGGDQEITLTDSTEILDYFDKIFGVSTATASLKNNDEEDIKTKALEIFDKVSVVVAGWLRIGRGSNASPAGKGVERPKQPLILYSYEGNQFCRLVREVLTELDIVYELRSAGKESPRRKELSIITGGSSQCPYLIDPNTGTKMAESADIVLYLYKTYANWTPPNEILQWTSENVMSLGKPIFKVLAPLQAKSSSSNEEEFEKEIAAAKSKIESTVKEHLVVMYTYEWSPFSFEAKSVLENLGIEYYEVSLGKEWIPGLIKSDGGAQIRAALLEKTGQSSLPHIFIGGESIGGLFTGTPGLIPALENGSLREMLTKALPLEEEEEDSNVFQ